MQEVQQRDWRVESMRSVVVFQWNEVLSHENVTGDEERFTTELSRPVAEALLSSLKNRGYAINVETPYAGERGWHFTLRNGDQKYSIFTMWTGIGEPNEDYFAIQPSLVRGWLASLFLARPGEDKLAPVCEILDEALKKPPSVSSLQWLSDQQFYQVYCRGEPLPKQS